MFSSSVNSEVHNQTNAEPQKAPIVENPSIAFPVAYFAVVDPMFSCVGDTLTLPRVLREQRAERLSRTGTRQKGSDLFSKRPNITKGDA